jgi:hypothetical protein
MSALEVAGEGFATESALGMMAVIRMGQETLPSFIYDYNMSHSFVFHMS